MNLESSTLLKSSQGELMIVIMEIVVVMIVMMTRRLEEAIQLEPGVEYSVKVITR